MLLLSGPLFDNPINHQGAKDILAHSVVNRKENCKRTQEEGASKDYPMDSLWVFCLASVPAVELPHCQSCFFYFISISKFVFFYFNDIILSD